MRTLLVGLLISLFFESLSLAQEKRSVVAVFDITTKNIKLNRAQKGDLTSLLAEEMGVGGIYQVMPPGDVKKALLSQSKKSFKHCYDEKCQIELGRQLPANKVLTTTIRKIGSNCRVGGSLYDLKRQTTDFVARATGKCDQVELSGLIVEMAGKIRAWGKEKVVKQKPEERKEVSRVIKNNKPKIECKDLCLIKYKYTMKEKRREITGQLEELLKYETNQTDRANLLHRLVEYYFAEYANDPGNANLRNKTEKTFSEIINNYRNYPHREEVLKDMGCFLRFAGDNKKASGAFRQLENEYPHSKFVPNTCLNKNDDIRKPKSESPVLDFEDKG